MARKSIKELEDRTETPRLFVEFLKKRVGVETYSFLEKVAAFSNVLIFSGVIRNYFINFFGKVRDFDLVIDCDESIFENFLSDYNYSKNSFGGYKIAIGDLKVDVWHIQKTWAFAENKLDQELFLTYSLPRTTFFNFSAIIFDFNNSVFVFNQYFKDFLATGKLDLVLKDNPLPQLCIVNTIYYKHKYKLGVAQNLKSYCLAHFDQYTELEFDQIQLKHFGEVKYAYGYLKEYMAIFKRNLSKKKK